MQISESENLGLLNSMSLSHAPSRPIDNDKIIWVCCADVLVSLSFNSFAYTMGNVVITLKLFVLHGMVRPEFLETELDQ